MWSDAIWWHKHSDQDDLVKDDNLCVLLLEFEHKCRHPKSHFVSDHVPLMRYLLVVLEHGVNDVNEVKLGESQRQ